MKQSIGNYVSHEGKEHGSKSNKEIMQSISSALLYGICSTSMAFINKLVMTSYKFDFPFLIMTCQMMFCIIFIEFLRMNSAFYIPRYSLKLVFSGKSFLWPSMFYALHSITALHALSGMSIPIYVAIKRCAPIVTLLLSIVLLKKELPSKKIILAVILISSGCILAVSFMKLKKSCNLKAFQI
ncbi:solute carrier family 35 member D3-like isoform X8 [Argiope bruennichi]|uniref:solute carrier family 35 member D3-like isoform X8 n=1 Tax=Argiope bruennichi TaxID=94029 RepID=UPI002494F2D5|nr:solute carrier family 35 member D3-like isoform X8 [Argiope bruennichi]